MSVKRTKESFRHSLSYKLRVAVSLMSVLPMLVCFYLVSNYILPKAGLSIDILTVILVSVFIAVIGFLVVKQIFDRVMSVSNEAKLIAAGDVSRHLDIPHDDEVGDLGDALNQLTQRIRSNMDELKNYGEKTNEINIEIQKRVLVLSSLLQISSLVSQAAPLDDILKLVTEKARLLANSEVAYLFFRSEAKADFIMKVADGINAEHLLAVRLDSEPAIFKKLIQTNSVLVIDKQHPVQGAIRKDLEDKFRLRNTVALPIFVRGMVVGVLGIGNTHETYSYRKEDLELMDIFAKQAAIAVENDILVHRVEKLEIKDSLTGLYNEHYIRNRLQEEIKRAIAYQRPCSFILLEIDDFKGYHDAFGSLQSENALKKVAVLIKDSVTDIDRVSRFSDSSFAVVLPEKNKRQASGVAEDIRKKVEFTFNEDPDSRRRITISGSITENPLDGITAEELVTKAKELLDSAGQKHKNTVFGFKEKINDNKKNN